MYQDHFCPTGIPITKYVITNDNEKTWYAQTAEDFFAERGVNYRWLCPGFSIITVAFKPDFEQGSAVPVIAEKETYQVYAAKKNEVPGMVYKRS
jgi:hypothetical protein